MCEAQKKTFLFFLKEEEIRLWESSLVWREGMDGGEGETYTHTYEGGRGGGLIDCAERSQERRGL